MSNIRKPVMAAPLAAALLLGGCATYASRPVSYSYSYFTVPCDTPGAFRAVPIPSPAAQSPAPAAASPATLPSAAVVQPRPGDAAQAGASECLIAVADRGRGRRRAGYYGGYYPGGYYGYPGGYYGGPFYESLGIGIGIGGHHYRGGHYRSGHSGGGHRGGGHH